jgi:general secretion pathway protein H
MLITGIWNSHCGIQKGNAGPGGFTLIELTMVILLLIMFLSLTIPRFRDAVLRDSLKNSSRKLISNITELRNTAIRDNIDYYLIFDIDSNRLWTDSPMIEEEEREDIKERAYTFPEDVRIIDIMFRDEGEKTTGITSIRFTREGYIRPSIIHLGSKDGRKFTFVLSPFLGRVELLEDYFDFEEIDENI